jgi:RNA-directed DNA polymerase
MKKSQMTVKTGASSHLRWQDFNWPSLEAQVKRLQMRIAKATRQNHLGKVRALQWLLTHSFAAKALAVKRVTSHKGAKSPGVDGQTWQTNKRKQAATLSLSRRGYQAQPLRRVYIRKQKGLRPLGIPTLKDRAMQALYLQALEPVAESCLDPNAYGFRPKRSTQDAIEQCFNVLARKHSPRWILEADIKSCFDLISHEWLMRHVVMDHQILAQWLKCGYLEKQQFYPTCDGVPQGGVASPTLANMALAGLEATIKAAAKPREKVNVVLYADDFIVTAASREALERLKPVISEFLAARGLMLSPKKTQITSIYQGFDFLGFNIRKYQQKLLIKPALANIKKMRATLKTVAHTSRAIKTINFIKKLNPKLLGWANYYRHVVSSRVFASIDHVTFQTVWRWAKRRHPKKSASWIVRRYFRRQGNRQWIFTALTEKKGSKEHLDLVMMNTIPIVRHVKIKAQATPYDPAYQAYFEQRELRRKRRLKGYWARHTPIIAPVVGST